MRVCADGSPTFIGPDGLVLRPVPNPPQVFTRLEAPLQPEEDLPVWDGTPFDVAYAVEVLYTSRA